MKSPKLAIDYGVREAATLTGLSTSMVDYLCRTELLVPTGRGKRGRGIPRRYSFGDVVMLRVLSRLLEHGIEIRRLKAALCAMRRRHHEITPTSLPGKLLVTDGKAVYLRHAAQSAEELTKGQFVFAFVLELDLIRKDVLKRVTSNASSTGHSRKTG